jgi:hypothetical protein
LLADLKSLTLAAEKNVFLFQSYDGFVEIDIVFEQIENISLKIFESFSFNILIIFSSLNLVGFPNFNFSKLGNLCFFLNQIILQQV